MGAVAAGLKFAPGSVFAAEEKKLNFYNWDTYIGEDTLSDFKDATGIDVTMDLFADNDELFAKLKGGNPGYDVIVPTNDFVERMITAGMLMRGTETHTFGQINEMLEGLDDSTSVSITSADQLTRELEDHSRVLVVGDFNVAPDDRDVHDPAAWAGQVLVSEPEREALGDLLALGFRDTFRLFEQPEGSFSWWDYRAAAFRRNMGLRIDLILASKPLAENCTACSIDKEPRRLERPSDHTPVVAEFTL